MSSIQDLFNVSDQLSKSLEIPHKLAVPKLTKIVVNAGIGKIKEDNKAIEKMKKDLSNGVDKAMNAVKKLFSPGIFKSIKRYMRL